MALLLAGVLAATAPAAAAPTEKILVLPFTIHAEKDMAFLNRGIVSMLLSRLNLPGKTVTESTQNVPGTPKAVTDLARSLGARYYTAGSVTIFGNSVNTDARLIETDTGRAVVAYSQYGERAGDVLAHMDAFARKVDARFAAAASDSAAAKTAASAGGSTAAAAATVAGTAAAVAAAGSTAAAPPPAPATTTIPPATKAIPPPPAPASADTSSAQAAAAGVAGVAVAAEQQTPGAVSFFESQEMGEEIRGLITGDIDGDGTLEIVAASPGGLSAFRYQGGKLIPVGGYNTPRELPIITVDAADLNGNGKSELFVARLDERPQTRDPNVRQWGLDSVVIEHTNGRLTETATGLKYYFRAMDTPEFGRVVFAQRRGVTGTYGEMEAVASRSDTGSLFLGNVFQLEHKNGEYVPGETVLLPPQVTLYDFALGDILNDGSDLVTTIYGKGYLTIREFSGSKKWTGKDRYGGSSVYLEFPSIEGTSQMDRYYLPQRLFVLDIDQDDQNEVVLVNNFDWSRSLASRLRAYDSGAVSCLEWGRRSMVEKWRTEEMGGAISDLAIADIDGDGRLELIYAVVEKSRTSFSNGKSYIVIQKPPAPGGK